MGVFAATTASTPVVTSRNQRASGRVGGKEGRQMCQQGQTAVHTCDEHLPPHNTAVIFVVVVVIARAFLFYRTTPKPTTRIGSFVSSSSSSYIIHHRRRRRRRRKHQPTTHTLTSEASASTESMLSKFHMILQATSAPWYVPLNLVKHVSVVHAAAVACSVNDTQRQHEVSATTTAQVSALAHNVARPHARLQAQAIDANGACVCARLCVRAHDVHCT